jgi:hypothetical protein
MTNHPDTGIFEHLFEFAKLKFAKKIGDTLSKAGGDATFRPIYPVADLGLSAQEREVSPKYIRLGVSAKAARNNESDFRTELERMVKNGSLSLDIAVAEDDSQEWQKIGSIELKQSYISYGCDRRLHFHHPKLR